MRRRWCAAVLVAGIVIACVPSGQRLLAGFLLGAAASALHQRLLALRVDGVLRQQPGSVLLVYLGPLVGLALLACPLLVAFVFPAHVSWVGALVGSLAWKAALYAKALIGGSVDD